MRKTDHTAIPGGQAGVLKILNEAYNLLQGSGTHDINQGDNDQAEWGYK